MTRLRNDRGATSVEFALVFPLFIGIVAVGAFFAWLAYTHAQVERAATKAARYAAVPKTDGTYDFCHGKVLALVNDALQSSTVQPSELTIVDGAGTLSPGACRTTPRKDIRVTVSHTFTNPFSSVVSMLTPTTGTFTVSGEGRARVESL